MTKFIVLTEIGFSERDYSRWGINKIKDFFKVKILDFTKISYPAYYEAHKEKIYQIKDYNQIKKICQAKKLIEEFNPNFAIDFMLPFSKNSKIISKFLKEKKIKIIHIQTGLVPEVKRTLLEKIHRLIFLILRPKIFCTKILRVLEFRFYGQNKEKNCDIVFLSGLKGSKKIFKNKKIVYTHSNDYELYLDYIKTSQKQTKNEKKLFIAG